MEPEKVKIITLKNEDTGTEDQYMLNLKPLGEGKSAKVFKATSWPDQTKLFAVKVIKITDQEVKKDYLRELRIIKNLPSCPHIVKTHQQHLQSEHNLYIFQEYCESGTLAQFKNQKLGFPLTEGEIYDIFWQTTKGLIFLLEAGIVHEDIKPANILKKGSLLKFCDFGVSEMEKQYIETTTRRGTISYMPPQKLKVKNFIPNDKSDIFSLGICLYEIIFGIHPYLQKKTTNYKQYLLALNSATLKPLSFLMKKIGSTSLQLENLFKFIQRMISLHPKTRAGIADLKDFLRLNSPFNSMNTSNFEESSYANFENKVSVNSNQVQAFMTSVVKYRESSQQNNLPVTAEKKQNQELGEQIRQRFTKESAQVIRIISLLITSIDLFRKINFNDWNITPVEKNFLGIDLTTCKLSRFIKYLIYQFSITLLRQLKQTYSHYLDSQREEQLDENDQYLQKQFNKFLIESDFKNKDQLASEIANRNNLNLWIQIHSFYQSSIQNLTIIEENKRNNLVCYLYCIFIPKILFCFQNMDSIFSKKSLIEIKGSPQLGNTTFEDIEILLQRIGRAEKEKKECLQSMVQEQLSQISKEFIFDLGEDSDEIEVITKKEIESL